MAKSLEDLGFEPIKEPTHISELGFEPIGPTVPKFSELESAGLGALQGGTLGFADEGEGAIRALANAPGSKKSLSDLYTQYRDLARQRAEQAQQQNPKSYMAGNIGGAVGTAFIPGLGEMNLAKAAALGGAAGLGASNADLLKGEVGKAAIDTGIGAALGSAGYGVAKGVGSLLNPANRATAASAAAVRGLGGKATSETLPVGREVLNEGLLPIFGGAEKTAEGITGRIGEIESGEVQPLLKSVSENTGLPKVLKGQPLMSDIVDSLAEKFKSRFKSSDAEKVGAMIDNDAAYWGQQLDAAGGNPSKLNDLRKAIDFQGKRIQKTMFQSDVDLTPRADFYQQLRGMVNDQLRTTASKVSSGAGEDLASAMGTQSKLIKAGNMAEKAAEGDINKPPGFAGINLKDAGVEGAGLAATMLGHPGIGVPTMVAGAGKLTAESATGQPINRLANIVSARTQDWASKNLATPLGKALTGSAKAISLKALPSTGVQTGIQSVYTSSPEALKSAADILTQSPGTKDIGEALHNAINSNDNDAKNKVLFAAEQLPGVRAKFRAALGEHLQNNNGPEDIEDFKNAISKVESGHDYNALGQPITHGMDIGKRAIGKYQFTPSTIDTIANNSSDPEIQELANQSDEEKQNTLLSNTNLQEKLATVHMTSLLKRFNGDKQKAAFAWNQGPGRVEEHFDPEHEYVQKFNRALASKEQ